MLAGLCVDLRDHLVDVVFHELRIVSELVEISPGCASRPQDADVLV
jgi:hypothetical protein